MTDAATLHDDFLLALEFVKKAPSGAASPSNSTKLDFYAFFKQATEGQNKGKRPGALDMINRAKFDAWHKLSNMSKDDAMRGYIKALEKTTANWKELAKKHNIEIVKLQVSASPTNATISQQQLFAPTLLQGKTALVTGGGSGIGKTIVQEFLRHGANCYILGRSKERLDQACKEFAGMFPTRKCIGISADVRNYDALCTAMDQIVAQTGKIDILVNGAAGNFLCPIEKLSTNAFKTVLEIDTVGTFNASKAAYVKSMKKNGGSIINLSMNLHYFGMPMQLHAGCAKGAIDYMTKHMCTEWGPNNVRINAIAIGAIADTEGYDRLSGSKDMQREWISKIPLQRIGQKDDIARSCVFLASDAASYMTGSILTVDGGLGLTGGGFMYPQILKMASKM